MSMAEGRGGGRKGYWLWGKNLSSSSAVPFYEGSTFLNHFTVAPAAQIKKKKAQVLEMI